MTTLVRTALTPRIGGFLVVVACLLIVSVGHLPLLPTDLRFLAGVPIWLWMQTAIVLGLLVLAWFGTGLLMEDDR